MNETTASDDSHKDQVQNDDGMDWLAVPWYQRAEPWIVFIAVVLVILFFFATYWLLGDIVLPS